MIRTYQKGVRVQLTNHFSTLDFDCKCTLSTCQTTLIDEYLPGNLESFWELSGPFIISSGFRCPIHNKMIGGAPGSYHCKGQAADCVNQKGLTGFHLYMYAIQVPAFNLSGIGTYPGWIHLDRGRPSQARWSFKTFC